MKTELRGVGKMGTTTISLQNSSTAAALSSLSGQVLGGCLGSLDGACIEKLLIHCASALESNDVTLAQQVMWVLNNVASSTGDPNQRLASWFLRALISRAGFHGPTSSPPRRVMSVTDLAGYVDLLPWHRFGFCAANSAVLAAVRGCAKVHVVDLSVTHCMQWPTLIDALAKRPDGPPPSLRISVVPSSRPPVAPLLDVPVESVARRLSNFAASRHLPFEFHLIDQESSLFDPDAVLRHLNPTALNLRDDEALIINCQSWIRYMSDENDVIRKVSRTNDQRVIHLNNDDIVISARDAFVRAIRDLSPHMVIVVDEDCDLTSPSLATRIAACFNYFWIPFDALETFLPKESGQRMEVEADIGEKIENIIGKEGRGRVERLETGAKLGQRMRNGGFASVPFGEDTVGEVKGMLDEHASGWGMKKEEDMLVLTWKGHNSVFATAWVPIGTGMELELELELDHA